jgi:hypothetical protein
MATEHTLAIGDRVRRRDAPHIQGYVWDTWDTGWPGMVIIKWDDPDENAYVRDASVLQKITPPRRGASGRGR